MKADPRDFYIMGEEWSANNAEVESLEVLITGSNFCIYI